jgi:hypothetical protein
MSTTKSDAVWSSSSDAQPDDDRSVPAVAVERRNNPPPMLRVIVNKQLAYPIFRKGAIYEVREMKGKAIVPG